MPRNLPVKRYDGEPLTRADVQHALLSHLFSSTERVFTNPRPGTRGIVPTPVYAGAAPSCSRRSDDPAPAPAVENAGAEVAAGEAGDEGEAGPSTRPSDLPEPGAEKLTFKELYIEALINSQKCTKSMRDKILTDEEYAEDFAKVCLLVNVGRINTTLACEFSLGRDRGCVRAARRK